MILSNIFGSSRYIKDPYNYEANLLGNVKMKQMESIVETALQVCPKCQTRKKNHYCIQLSCKHRELICPQCDANHIDQKHYLHDYSYVLPFLTKDIFTNFFKLKKKFVSFHEDIQTEIRKIQDYLKELNKVQATVCKQLSLLEQQEKQGRIKNYIQNMTDFVENYSKGEKLKYQLDNVLFLSAQQCQAKEEEIKNLLISSLDTLKWPKDPQRVLKDKLKSNLEDQKKQIFISMFKPVEISQIDANFRANSQFYTDNLKNHLIEIKLDSDLLGKPKFYESFIYHFRDCQKLFIENGNVNHLRTPLTFRNLKSLEFNFNLEAEPQNIKLDLCTQQLRELTLRRFREEDLKLLKQITAPCVALQKLHLQFSNKVDLYGYKDLVQFLRQERLKSLVSLTLKIRTQSEVKRLYGYLSKFTKQQGEANANLNLALLQVIDTNPCLTRIVVQGVKPLEMPIIVSKMKKLHFLMDYRIYFQNLDLMTQVDDREAKSLQMMSFRRKRIFYALAKASKNKYFPKAVIDHIVSDYLI